MSVMLVFCRRALLNVVYSVNALMYQRVLKRIMTYYSRFKQAGNNHINYLSIFLLVLESHLDNTLLQKRDTTLT